MFLFFICFYECPSLKCPMGLCYMDTWRDEWLGFLRDSSSHFPGLCRLVLTCSHDSLFLRYPAIDVVWLGPVSLTFGYLRHLALRDSAWWSLSPGWCSLQSLSRMSRLPFRTLTHDDGLQYSSCGISSGINPQWWVCTVCVSMFPLLLLLVYYSGTSRRPGQWLKSCYLSVQVIVLLEMLF